jgi:hypothetical protein
MHGSRQALYATHLHALHDCGLGHVTGLPVLDDHRPQQQCGRYWKPRQARAPGLSQQSWLMQLVPMLSPCELTFCRQPNEYIEEFIRIENKTSV